MALRRYIDCLRKHVDRQQNKIAPDREEGQGTMKNVSLKFGGQ